MISWKSPLAYMLGQQN